MSQPFIHGDFETLKSNILIDLQLGIDKSNRGFIDEEISDIVAAINRTDGFVTTSSCAGRTAFFHKDFTTQSEGDTIAPKKRGNGLGITWNSHSPFERVKYGEIIDTGYPRDLAGNGSLELKFEPVILHILCRDLEAASRLVLSGIDAGLKKSGIIVSSKGKVNVSLCGAFGFNTPLWVQGKEIVPRSNVPLILDMCNDLFKVNAARRVRLLKAILSL
eukprot:PhM_4_TR7040/c0_g1_i1/m.89754/K15450/TYW3; tRNA wybutosine-synthesizing protein 3